MQPKIKDSDVYHFHVDRDQYLGYIRTPDDQIITLDGPVLFETGTYIAAIYGKHKEKADLYKYVVTADVQDEM